tara:strand:+ start:9225 stop:10511 length:1287 start_codon:yes stop_codon:yes gene_type:complete
MIKIGLIALGILCMPNFAIADGKIDDKNGASNETYHLLNMFSEAFRYARNDYVNPVSDKKLIEAAIEGMLSSLDPHSGYISQDHYQELLTDIKSEFGGVGIEFTLKNGMPTIIATIDGSPANKAGLKSGDVIVAINQISTQGLSMVDLAEMLRGQAKEPVEVKIERVDADPLTVTLKREKIQVKDVSYELQGNVGYIRISNFWGEKVKTQVSDAIKNLKNKSKEKLAGLIIDLRNNPGGLLTQAIEISDLFLDKGDIVTVKSRKKEDSITHKATPGDICSNTPVVLLIDEGTASSAEIVAGALQDNGRAILLGSPSFGKGTVQFVLPLSPGYTAVRLTTGLYLTPNGRSIQADGIIPDIYVKKATIKTDDEKRNTERNSYRAFKATSNKRDQYKLSNNLNEDYQLMRAHDVLKALDFFEKRQKGQTGK